MVVMLQIICSELDARYPDMEFFMYDEFTIISRRYSERVVSGEFKIKVEYSTPAQIWWMNVAMQNIPGVPWISDGFQFNSQQAFETMDTFMGIVHNAKTNANKELAENSLQ